MVSPDSLGEFLPREYSRIHWPAKPRCWVFEREKDVRVRQRVANDHHIDVACSGVLSLRDGAKDKRRDDAIPMWQQRLSQWLDDAHRLAYDGAEFSEDRRLRVGLIVLLVAYPHHRHKPTLRKAGQLTLDGARSTARARDKFARVEATFRPPEKIIPLNYAGLPGTTWGVAWAESDE